MKKLVLIVVLCLLAFSAFSEPLDLSLYPEAPTLIPQNGDDMKVSVTIYEMRQALWFQQMYLITRDTLFDYDAQLVTAIGHERDDVKVIEKLDGQLVIWQGATLGVSAALVVTVLLLLVH